jgi:hypothetical protein
MGVVALDQLLGNRPELLVELVQIAVELFSLELVVDGAGDKRAEPAFTHVLLHSSREGLVDADRPLSYRHAIILPE